MRGDIKSLEVRCDVVHRYARTEVLGAVENPADESKVLTFGVLLPEEAFISGFEIAVGGTACPVRVVERREEARAEYEEAVRAGRTAAHVQLSARHANLFTVALHVAARDKAAFTLTYEQLLAREHGRYRLRLLLDPGQVVQRLLVEARIRDSAPLALVRVAKLRAADSEVDDAADAPDDPLATVQRPSPTEALVRWEAGEEAQRALATGDGLRGLLEVQYDVKQTDTSQLLMSEGGYFVHFFSLPESHLPMPKHLVFVLDICQSMYGSKMQQMKEAMAAILSELSESDAFSLVTFSAETRVWVRGLGFVAATEGRRNTVVGATSDMVLEAREVVGQLQHQPTAGTQLLGAVLAAYRAVREGREWTMDGAPRQPLVLLLAGGQDISAERSELLRAVAAASADPAACAPLYSLAFGRDADFGLLKQLSLRGKGFARKVYEAADAALQLRNFYRRVASPLLADVSFHYADDQVEASSLTRAAFPVLLAGAELAVAGVGVGEEVGGGLRATVRGAAGGRRLERAAAVQRVEPQQASFVERLWAYLTVRQLLERADGGDAQAKARARELALRYAFVTSVTSLVVVKPDDQTGGADLRDADEPFDALPGLMGVAQPICARSGCGPQVLYSARKFRPSEKLFRQSSRAYTATDYDANPALPNYTDVPAFKLVPIGDNSSFSEGEGLTLTPAVLRVELTSMQTPRSDPTLCGPSGGHSEDAATKTFCIAPPPARRRKPGLRQWIAAVIVNMLYMAEAAGYLARQKIIFSPEDDMPSIRRSINVLMWVAGILSFLLHSIILQLLKRKFHIIIICIVYYATALAMSIDTDNSYKTNYFISVLWAIASTGTMMFVSVYISETTPDHTRGRLIAIKTLFRYLVFSFSLLEYPLIPHSWLVIAIPTVVLLSCFWLPETPVYLLRRGNVGAAKQSLRRLHGNAAEVEQEVEMLRTLLKATHSDTNNTIAAIRKFSNIRTLGYSGLAITLSLLDFLSGIVLAEGNIMVQNIGVGKGQLLPMLIINLIIFISCTMTGLLMCDRIGHRKTLLVSIVVCSVALLLNGIWYWNVDSFWVLSIIAFLLAALHFFGYSFGMSFLPTAITIDIFPPSLLYILLAITGIISWPFYSDRNISIYNYTFDTIYIYLLLLSAVCALTVPLVYFLLPETTNKHVGALLLENRVVNTTCPDNENSRSNKYNESNSSSTSPQA